MLLTLPPSDTANNMCGATVMAVFYELLFVSLVGLTATSLAEGKSFVSLKLQAILAPQFMCYEMHAVACCDCMVKIISLPQAIHK